MKPRGKPFYDRLAVEVHNSIRRKYKNDLTRFGKAGSRNSGTHQRTSDLDMRFSLNNNPSKRNIYPELIDHMEDDLPDINEENLRYQEGEERNIIKIFPANGGRADLVLLTESDFDRQQG